MGFVTPTDLETKAKAVEEAFVSFLELLVESPQRSLAIQRFMESMFWIGECIATTSE